MGLRILKTTALAAVAGAIWTQVAQVSVRSRRLSLKCWFMGHDDWIRRTPDRLYLECFECGRETPGWSTRNHPVHQSGGPSAGAPVLTDSAPAMVRSPLIPSTRADGVFPQHGGGMTIAA